MCQAEGSMTGRGLSQCPSQPGSIVIRDPYDFDFRFARRALCSYTHHLPRKLISADGIRDPPQLLQAGSSLWTCESRCVAILLAVDSEAWTAAASFVSSAK